LEGGDEYISILIGIQNENSQLGRGRIEKDLEVKS
jgi:hypothetical protein